MAFLKRVFPAEINNEFPGHPIALYAFYALRFALPYFKEPMETVGTAPGATGDIVFMVLGPILFVLSVVPLRRTS